MNSVEFKDLEFYYKIGQGSFGKVWEGSYLGTPVAIKECLPTEDETHFDFLKYFEREADLLSESRHPNIVQFLGTCVHDSKFYIVTEYVPGGTMKSWIISGKANDIRTRLSFAIDISRALTYLHTRNIMHRDLKPSNLLITENKRIKVCDFGFARLFALSEDERRRMTVCGTDEYMAPELLQGNTCNELADVFGFGIILCELISLKTASLQAFKRTAPDFKIHATEVKDRATKDCPSDLVALAIKCISQDPVERPTMREVLSDLCAIENSFKSIPSIHIGSYRESQNNRKCLPAALNTSLNPNTNLSKQTSDPDNIMPYTPNLVYDISIHSSDLSPDSNCSNMCIRDPSIISRTGGSIQEVLNISSDTAKDLPQPAPEISILHKSPFQNFFISEASIQLGQMAVPQIDGSQGTAKFAFQELSKLNHEGIEVNIPRQLPSVAITGRGHRFSIQRIDAHETCSFCQQRLSDFLDSTYGMVCDDCGFLCHKRCSTLAPYNCDAPSPAHRALTSLFAPLSSME